MILARLATLLVLALIGCAAPQTQLGSVSHDQVAIEAARQQQFALELALKQQHRLQNVAIPLLEAAAPFCGDRVRGASGFVATNAYRWKKDYYNAALSAGFSDTLVVLNVAPNSAAAVAGLVAGDRVLAVNDTPILIGRSAIDDLSAKIPSAKDKLIQSYRLTIRRGDDTSTIQISPRRACAYTPIVTPEDMVNAYADGHSIFVTAGIMRFLPDDDDLAVVVAHEIAHDAMRHIDAQMKNSLIGTLLGAVVDVAAASQGVNTDFASQGAKLGAMVFSQDFEREADYVGLYILALGGRPFDKAANLWRQIGAANPGSIKFATTHPTTAERFVRLDTWRNEVSKKVALGQPLQPEMKNGKTFITDGPGTMVAASRSAPGSSLSTLVSPRSSEKNHPLVPGAGISAQQVASEIPSTRRNDLDDKKIVPEKIPKSVQESRTRARALTANVEDRGAHAIIGAPSSDSARIAAAEKFIEAQRLMGSHKWQDAEAAYRETLLLDGSVAKYHASLAKLFSLLRRYEEAIAEYTAATLLDLDNPAYRRLLKEARTKR
jgi:predicted Zn-dependent protease